MTYFISHKLTLFGVIFKEASEKNVTIKSGCGVKKTVDRENTTDNESLLSTSSNLEPFASDDLGMHVQIQKISLLAPAGWCFAYSWDTFLSLSLFFLTFIYAPAGNTVIHLDKALARMREYERMKLRAEFNTDNSEHGPGAAAAAAAVSAPTQGTTVTARCQDQLV